MNPTRYLSRARLRHDVPPSALREALSRIASARAAAAHHLIWTLFGDTSDRRRDFLWREAEPGVFYMLSARPPNPNDLFHLDPPKPFAPVLRPGDRLHFVLRANATVARKPGGAVPGDGVRGERCDIVMDAIRDVPEGERAGPRQAVLPGVAARWLGAQGGRHGFAVARREPVESWESAEAWASTEADEGSADALDVMGYRVLRIARGSGRNERRRDALQLGVLDLEGTLIVENPDRFVTAVADGFGRAKAFGCGLMLFRRAT
jgi:CRISPR system Cascade subunit CasE